MIVILSMNLSNCFSNIEDQNVFLKIIELSLPRILGLCDRSNDSNTFGCFDRYYWHYRLLDLPNIRFQEAAYILAIIYRNRIIDSFYQNEKVKYWCIGAIDYAFSRQNRDGSFNEVYPYERSFVATAFTGWSLIESILLLELVDWRDSVDRLANWLLKHDNPSVSNQMAGAANALYLSYLHLGDQKFLNGYRKKIDRIVREKGKKPYLPEYGGADIGYLSIALSHLATLYRHSKDQHVRHIADDAATYIDLQLDENGSYDWTTGSRKTQYVYPYGLAALNRFDALDKLGNGLRKNRIINPCWMDDRYCIPFTLDYLLTFHHLQQLREQTERSSKNSN